MRATRPLVRPDPGWLFLLAGLALVLSAAVIPSSREMHALATQLEELRQVERMNDAVRSAFERLLRELEEGDPALLRRLAASQLNVIPKGETPILMASSANAGVAEWVESAVEAEPFVADPPPHTLLAQWTEGRNRLWSIGAGVFLVFVGLLLTPTAAPAGAGGALEEGDESDDRGG